MKHTLLIILLLTVLPGCNLFGTTHPQMSETWPVYTIPDKPKLNLPATVVPGKNPELDVTIKCLYDVITYADSLKIIIDTHNTAAKAHNQQVESDLGITK